MPSRIPRRGVFRSPRQQLAKDPLVDDTLDPKKLIAEAIGTFTLIFAGAGAIVLTRLGKPVSVRSGWFGLFPQG